jgi:hypothetical protein
MLRARVDLQVSVCQLLPLRPWLWCRCCSPCDQTSYQVARWEGMEALHDDLAADIIHVQLTGSPLPFSVFSVLSFATCPALLHAYASSCVVECVPYAADPCAQEPVVVRVKFPLCLVRMVLRSYAVLCVRTSSEAVWYVCLCVYGCVSLTAPRRRTRAVSPYTRLQQGRRRARPPPLSPSRTCPVT